MPKFGDYFNTDLDSDLDLNLNAEPKEEIYVPKPKKKGPIVKRVVAVVAAAGLAVGGFLGLNATGDAISEQDRKDIGDSFRGNEDGAPVAVDLGVLTTTEEVDGVPFKKLMLDGNGRPIIGGEDPYAKQNVFNPFNGSISDVIDIFSEYAEDYNAAYKKAYNDYVTTNKLDVNKLTDQQKVDVAKAAERDAVHHISFDKQWLGNVVYYVGAVATEDANMFEKAIRGDGANVKPFHYTTHFLWADSEAYPEFGEMGEFEKKLDLFKLDIDGKFTSLYQRFENVEQSIGDTNIRIDGIEVDLTQITNRINKLEIDIKFPIAVWNQEHPEQPYDPKNPQDNYNFWKNLFSDARYKALQLEINDLTLIVDELSKRDPVTNITYQLFEENNYYQLFEENNYYNSSTTWNEIYNIYECKCGDKGMDKPTPGGPGGGPNGPVVTTTTEPITTTTPITTTVPETTTDQVISNTESEFPVVTTTAVTEPEITTAATEPVVTTTAPVVTTTAAPVETTVGTTAPVTEVDPNYTNNVQENTEIEFTLSNENFASRSSFTVEQRSTIVTESLNALREHRAATEKATGQTQGTQTQGTQGTQAPVKPVQHVPQ
ncbi:MAG: hypothetical protein LBM38_05105 [Clostridiales bacterium]|nr:hypothetical protein [Clostridiales bacterium]